MTDDDHNPVEVAGYAPKWVRSVLPSAVARQRSAGWPDFHPEDFCHLCGQRNPVWSAESEAWFAVHPEARGSDGGGICCPTCFTLAHAEATGSETVWILTPLLGSQVAS